MLIHTRGGSSSNILFVVCSLCLVFTFHLVEAQDDAATFLGKFYNSTGGPKWKNNTNWLQGDPCPSGNWFGVTCSGVNVVALNLLSNGLSGNIPSTLGNLTTLQTLYLGGDDIKGTIPYLGRLQSLTQLSITNQPGITGTIPNWFNDMPALTQINLSWNSHSGSIPSTLCMLPSLKILSLAYNQLDGTIPNCLANTTSLTQLSLDHNSAITGTIPAKLGLLTQLTHLSLARLNLIGHLPDISKLNNILYFNVDGNNLNGSLPAFGKFSTGVTLLDFGRNQFVGTIPASYQNLTALSTLVLDDNQLVGTIPQWIATQALYFLDLSCNKFTDPLPKFLQTDPNFGNFPNLAASFQCNSLDTSILPSWCDKEPIGNGNCVQADCDYLCDGQLPDTTASATTTTTAAVTTGGKGDDDDSKGTIAGLSVMVAILSLVVIGLGYTVFKLKGGLSGLRGERTSLLPSQ